MTINFQIYWWARCDVLHQVQTVSSLWAHLLNPHSITCTCLHFCFSQWWQRQPQRVGEYLFAYLQLSRTAQYVTLSVCPLLRHHSPTVICHVSCMKRHVCQVGYPWKEHYIRRTLTSKVMAKNWFSGILPFVYVGGPVLREGEIYGQNAFSCYWSGPLIQGGNIMQKYSDTCHIPTFMI